MLRMTWADPDGTAHFGLHTGWAIIDYPPGNPKSRTRPITCAMMIDETSGAIVPIPWDRVHPTGGRAQEVIA